MFHGMFHDMFVFVAEPEQFGTFHIYLHEREEFGTIRNTVTIRKFQSFQFGTIWNNSTTLYFRHFSLYWITALTTDGGSV